MQRIGRTQVQRWFLMVWIVAGICLASLPDAQAQRRRPLPQRTERTIKSSADDGLQPDFERPAPLKSVKPGDDTKKEALAWFMTGRLRESRNDPQGAYDAYKKALQADSEAVDVYRALVPLAFRLQKADEAIELALKVFELDPDNVELRQQVSLHFLRQNRFEDAIRILEEAKASKSLDKNSPIYVSINELLANLYQATGDAEKAADSLEVVFQAIVDPSRFHLEPRVRRVLRAANLERLGEAFLQVSRTDLAVEAFELAVERGQATESSIAYNLAAALRQKKEPEAALAKLQLYFDARLKTRGKAAYQLLADLLEDQGKRDELIPRLRKLSENDARNIPLSLFLADEYVEQKQYDEARDLYQATLENSRDKSGYVGLIRIGRLQREAEPLFQALMAAADASVELQSLQSEVDAIAADDELMEAVLKLSENSADQAQQPGPESLYLLGKLSIAAKRNDAATDLFRRAIRQNPDRENLLVLYQELANHLFDQRQYGEASEVYREAIEDPALRSQRPMMLFRMSQALELNGQTDEAIKAVLEARKTLPGVGLLYYQEAWIHYHAQNWDKAIELFENVIKRFPQDKETVRRCQFSLSAIYVQQGDIPRGEKILEDVFAEEPDDPSVNNDLGYLYADQGKNLEQAERMIRKAIAAEPDNAAYQDSMGWVLYKLERYDEALDWLKKAVDTPSGGDPTILDHLGDCYHKLDRQEKARESWRQALDKATQESRPDQKLVKQLQEKLAD